MMTIINNMIILVVGGEMLGMLHLLVQEVGDLARHYYYHYY